MDGASEPMNWLQTFQDETSKHPVFIYAKGEKGMAVCGFSARVMGVFDRLGVDYAVRNILADPAIRQELSAWTNWPTIPQVFVGGKFIGGADIVTEMYESGELRDLVDQASTQKA
jgi:monothiol glutaredoxin